MLGSLFIQKSLEMIFSKGKQEKQVPKNTDCDNCKKIFSEMRKMIVMNKDEYLVPIFPQIDYTQFELEACPQYVDFMREYKNSIHEIIVHGTFANKKQVIIKLQDGTFYVKPY